MTGEQKRSILLVAGAVSLLTFLFVQQHPLDSGQHDRVVLDFQLLERLDAEVNADLLSSRYDLLRSYDPFVKKLEEMHAAAAGLENIPGLMSRRNKEQMVRLLAREGEVLSEKAQLVERFKSDNAVLKNSLRYFPVLTAEASGSAAGKTIIQDHLANLLRDVLIYDLTPHSDLTGELNSEIEAAVQNRGSVNNAHRSVDANRSGPSVRSALFENMAGRAGSVVVVGQPWIAKQFLTKRYLPRV